jgi:hypothetical protein
MTDMPPFLRPLSTWDDQALWRGDDCPACTEDLVRVGVLPSYCDTCGADRSASGELWSEICRRNLEYTLWDGCDEIELGGAR